MTSKIDKSFQSFLDACGRDYEFPAGGRIPIPTQKETDLYENIQKSSLSMDALFKVLSTGLDWESGYSMVIFGVRISVLGLRESNLSLARTGAIAFLSACHMVDSRDVMGDLAVVEECAKQQRISFMDEFEGLLIHRDDENVRSLLNSYFSRPSKMRSLDVMGLKAVQERGEVFFLSQGR